MNIKNIKISCYISIIVILFLAIDFIGYKLLIKNIENNYEKDTKILFYKIQSETNNLISQLMYEYSLQKNILITKHKIANEYVKKQDSIFSHDLSKLKDLLNQNQKNSPYNIYLSNDNLIIKNTTYQPDMDFNLSFAKKIFDEHYSKKEIGICSPLFERASSQFISYTDSYIIKDNKKLGVLQLSYSYPDTKKNVKKLKLLLNDYKNIVDVQAYLISDSGIVSRIIFKDFNVEKVSQDKIKEDTLNVSKIKDKLQNNTIYKKRFILKGKHYQQIYLSSRNAIFKDKRILYSIIFEDTLYYEKIYDINIFMLFITFIGVLAIFFISKIRDYEVKLYLQEELYVEQSKLALMGEMIGNIAHQWRQPLNVISAASSSAMLQKNLGILEDDTFYKTYKNIDKNVKFLSQTIDDFRNFIQNSGLKEEFLLKDMLNSFLILNDSVITNNNIQVITDLEEELKINSYKNELIQCLLNIFNNSLDALNQNNIIDKYLFITIKKQENNIIINIKDNALGIPDNILNKIFQPYFTTKHQSQGTGLGLYMTHKLITEGLEGTISVKNEKYKYGKKDYRGACFTITIPL